MKHVDINENCKALLRFSIQVNKKFSLKTKRVENLVSNELMRAEAHGEKITKLLSRVFVFHQNPKSDL